VERWETHICVFFLRGCLTTLDRLQRAGRYVASRSQPVVFPCQLLSERGASAGFQTRPPAMVRRWMDENRFRIALL